MGGAYCAALLNDGNQHPRQPIHRHRPDLHEPLQRPSNQDKTKTNLQHACIPGPSGGVGSLVPLDPRLRRSSFLLFSRTVISLAAHPVPRPRLVTWFSYSQSQTLLNVSCFPSPPGVHQLQPLPPSQVPTTFQLRASTMQVYNIVRSDPMCQSSPGGRN